MKIDTNRSFIRDMRRIRDADTRRRVERKLTEIQAAANITEVSSVRHLNSLSGNDYRIRIGDYRLGVIVVDDVATLVRFGHRSDFYRGFP